MQQVALLLKRLWSGQTWQRLRGWFQAYQADEPAAGAFRARQLQAVLRLTPLMMVANAVNVLLVAAACWSTGEHVFLALWGLGVTALVAQGARVWWRWHQHPGDWHTASHRAMQRATQNAAVLAGFWAAMPVVLFPHANGAQQLLVATITTGMMCAGGFALATVPAAGTAYVVVLGGGAAMALFSANFPLAWPMGGLLLVYGFIVVASVWSTARLFGARLMAEAEAERQNEVIGLLLRDFEENASDVLWETDARGRLVHASARLLTLFGLQAQRPDQRPPPVLELLQGMTAEADGAAGHLAKLSEHLASGQPFRDLPLAATRDGHTRWWSLSAKPLLDGTGRLRGWRGVASDITEAQRANRQLSWLAHYDALTQLANRHQLRQELADMLKPGTALMRPFAVLCLDLDHFKTINDTLGHAVGDGLLQAVADRLRKGTRRSDTVARLGGDEFAIILREVASADEARQLTERLLAALQTPCEVQGARIAVRTSVGIALAPQDGDGIDTLLNNADLALYAAKSAGRGEYRFFEPDMAVLTRRRLVIEQELRHALHRGELHLEYQPQISLGEWRVTGVEAMLRWRHTELGDVSPVEFIPVAEEAGLIGDIGQWVLQQACAEATAWPPALTVAVNVSAVQAMGQDLERVAMTALHQAGLAPARLELEITESIFLGDTQATLQVLHGLRSAGLRVALDDFGTGYSALAYLRRFPFDTLKIDRSFVRELLQRRDARAIVKMIVGLAHTLNMKTVAEGVEDAAQAGVLREYGCDMAQGYLMARPMRAAAVGDFLAGWGRQPAVPRPEPLETMPVALDGR